MFANLGNSFQPAAVALERISELMEIAGEEESENGIRIKSINSGIEFRNVSFSYDNRTLLSDINIYFKKGEKVILAGPNGSGKSTIIKLILGLYKPQKGSILIDDRDITKLSLSSLRKRISIVSQNTFLFNDTVRNNIIYSNPEAEEEEIKEAARLSGAYDFIKGLDGGFDTTIGERGVRLSGGERQKISIARAILKDSDMIIFDEATTHLDAESERKVNALIQSSFKDKTCIIISHKIRNIPGIDRIYCLREGKIIDERIFTG
jgi:ABC-type multidrug transport system fused ATPase/permease subunit